MIIFFEDVKENDKANTHDDKPSRAMPLPGAPPQPSASVFSKMWKSASMKLSSTFKSVSPGFQVEAAEYLEKDSMHPGQAVREG